uniref:Protein kinase domain-containing protein n=1 Tax=Panagrolaimus sp. JU765 TaxID=591449 RepID=A0AC34QXN8_9BILA
MASIIHEERPSTSSDARSMNRHPPGMASNQKREGQIQTDLNFGTNPYFYNGIGPSSSGPYTMPIYRPQMMPIGWFVLFPFPFKN